MKLSTFLSLLPIPAMFEDPITPATPQPSLPAANQSLVSIVPSESFPPPVSPLSASLSTLQLSFFNTSYGTYPTAIDWTSAVISTIHAATLRTLLPLTDFSDPSQATLFKKGVSNLLAAFWGENADSIKLQAFDDILWVTLEWIEATRLLNEIEEAGIDVSLSTSDLNLWRGRFLGRARDFWTIAKKGWSDELCGGGINWSPWLEVYKNAVTNQLWISASSGLYWYDLGVGVQQREVYLDWAVRGYAWLNKSGMRNRDGLYTDGFHISGLYKPNAPKICDNRNDDLYTYNQGILLSGLRNLYLATGEESYVDDGMELLRAIVGSDGVLVKGGMLEERCDRRGCNQNGGMFKGIWAHHVTEFCTPLPGVVRHGEFCREKVRPFVERNAEAAWDSRRRLWRGEGAIGCWWGATEKRALPVNMESLERQGARWTEGIGGWMQVFADGSGINDKVEFTGTAGGDVNDRGRGRMVECQAGGMAIIRARVEAAGW